MLSRHAENIFWIGRYLERAEDTARMLDVTYHAVLEAQSSRSPEELWAELLEVLFLEDESSAILRSADGPGPLLVADRRHPGSVMSLLARARENARGTREWLSSEFWEAINGLLLDLSSSDLSWRLERRPYDVFRSVKSGCHMLVGVSEASMPRGEGYRFLELGRMVERASITARVLSVWHRRLGGFTHAADFTPGADSTPDAPSPPEAAFAPNAAFSEWVKLLRTLAAYEAYLRAHRASMEPGPVLVFLLQSTELPRSLLYSLRRCESHLEAAAWGSIGLTSRRTAGTIRSRVEFLDPTSLASSQLSELLEYVETAVLGLAANIEEDFFQMTPDSTIHSYEAF